MGHALHDRGCIFHFPGIIFCELHFKNIRMSILLSVLWGGLIGGAYGLLFWRRRKETDRDGNPCLRYFGPRFGFPVLACLALAIGVHEVTQQCGIGGAVFFLILFAFCAFASIHFAFYRMTLTQEQLVRSQWLLAPLHLQLKRLTFIGRQKQCYVLYFGNETSLKIPQWLSGQEDFIARLQHIMLALRPPPSYRPGRTRRPTQKS